nr:MAG TPA: hypothetical protein [Caudoviricetes sp.]
MLRKYADIYLYLLSFTFQLGCNGCPRVNVACG